MKNTILGLAVLFTLYSCKEPGFPESVQILSEQDVPQVLFAISELKKACSDNDISLLDSPENLTQDGIRISFSEDPALGFESYRMVQEGNSIAISGGDPKGMMYAGLELADYIRLGKDLQDLGTISDEPYIKHRGLRFNIPLDARTPSYDDTGDAAQKNIATVWEFDFWEQYLDKLAKDRYNLLTFWNLHPYPSWVKVPGYPDVALEDVCVYTGEIDSRTDMKWKDLGIQDPENLRVIKEMSIEEKIAFWQKVFQYAQDRGIDIYLFHWNVFVNGAEGKHGIEWRQDSPITADYIRQSVKQMLLIYPNIKGIGVTAGEHIDRSLTGEYKTENWMWMTYGQGIMDAKKINPELEVRFIFRRHWSDLEDIMEVFRDYDGEFETSFKYSRAHMYSSATPPWFDKIYRSTVEQYGLKCWLNIRNDDIFTFRWGDPDYAREYIKNIPYELTPGFYMGPDGYVWGREFTGKNPQTPRQLAVEKHWYRFMIWGRTAYNPDLPDSFYSDRIRLRFPDVDAGLLFETWKASSDIISWVDKVHFRQNDYQFSPEGCFDVDSFHTVNSFIGISSMPEQEVVSISEYARSEGSATGISPFDVADSLESAAAILLKGSGNIDPGNDPELMETLGDLRSLAYLGQYYACKIRGSTYTATYRRKGNEEDKLQAIKELEAALVVWKQYALQASGQYHPQLLARTRVLDWNALIPLVEKDIEIARNAKQGESIEILENNSLWERDTRRF